MTQRTILPIKEAVFLPEPQQRGSTFPNYNLFSKLSFLIYPRYTLTCLPAGARSMIQKNSFVDETMVLTRSSTHQPVVFQSLAHPILESVDPTYVVRSTRDRERCQVEIEQRENDGSPCLCLFTTSRVWVACDASLLRLLHAWTRLFRQRHAWCEGISPNREQSKGSRRGDCRLCKWRGATYCRNTTRA